MESRIIPHLYFAGECLDYDGITGGFNFQGVWTRAYIARKTMTGKIAINTLCLFRLELVLFRKI